MKKTTRIVASLAALGALCVGGVAIAAPWHHCETPVDGMPCAGMNAPKHSGAGMPCAPQAQNRAEMRAAGWEAIGRILTLRPEQEGVWKNYVEARMALDAMPGTKFDKPAVDMQSRFERRAQIARVRADLLDKVVAARAELLKAFGPEQKYVLESFELQHGMKGPKVKGPKKQEGAKCPMADKKDKF